MEPINSSVQARAFIDIGNPIDGSQLTPMPPGEEDICGPLSKPYLLFVSAGPAMVSVENLVFLFAVLLYRKKLHQNNVYTYVTSALIANLVTSLWAFYHFLNYHYGLESAEPTFWWAFRKGITAGFSLILCGNIGLLIYAIEDNIYMMGRLVSGSISVKSANNRLTREFRLKKALFLIAAVWIFPVFYGLLSMTPWNCMDQCTCTLYLKSGQPICKGESCSSLYTPMAKSYLLVIVIIWFIECFFLSYVICRASFYGHVRPEASNRLDTSHHEEDESSHMDSGNNNACKRKANHARRFYLRIDRKHRFPFILHGLFILCTAPVMILFVLDFFVKNFQPGNIVINVITPLPLLYCFISPILLTNRLSGMKSALVMTLSFNWAKSGFSSFSRGKSNRTGSATAPIRGSMVSLDRDANCPCENMPTQV